MNRRKFLQSGIAIGAAGVCASPILAGQFTGRIRKSLKYSMIDVRLSLVQQFQLLKRADFDGVEISLRDGLSPQEVRAATDATEIAVHGVIHGAGDDCSASIDLCEQVGGSTVLVVAPELDNLSYADNFARSLAVVRKAIPLAEKQNVRLLIENVRASFLKTAEEMARFIDELESPAIGAYYDTGNTITWTKQTAQHWAHVLGHRIVKVDIKDRGHAEFGDPKLKSQTAVGTDGGEVHWANVRRELAAVNFSGWASAEVKGGDARRLSGVSKWMDQVLDL
ncbi:sugar phosphate isomerase/epimerase family protein [Rubripirellula reticaptiva]|uniref:Xylose isomerase-like TIM barrel n=1 Tax=Rubripirellula reticaptiva TaxID=2528013 RepID=A0A5C6EE36_9BACT|nr:sugar phosphate isomerase/epimerase family protein [Rubripirellula reticaptiva]TWU48003.1 Xylose isomerase-like TIM barrel [Rubripirellula reticaptiva]